MANQRIPESAKHPLSLQADYANPRLWGGAGILVGMVGLAAGIVSATTGRLLVAASLGGLGALVFGVGYWMYTRGA